MPGFALPRFLQPDVAGSVPARNMLSESADPFAGLQGPSVPSFAALPPRANVDSKADHLASGHYAEAEHEGPDNKKPFERAHQVGEKAITGVEHMEEAHHGSEVAAAAEHLEEELPGISGLDTFMGPLGAVFANDELVEGTQDGDTYKVMKGGAGIVGAGSATIEALGSLITGVTGVAAGGGGAIAAAGPASGAFIAGGAVGHGLDRGINKYGQRHGFHDGMTSDQHRIVEGQKIDHGNGATVAGANRAVEVAYEDIILGLNNMGFGSQAGIADSITDMKRANLAAGATASLNDMPVSEDVAMHVASTTSAPTSAPTSADNERSYALARQMAVLNQGLVDTAHRQTASDEIQMPAMDMRVARK